jgi:hypothetical protein
MARGPSKLFNAIVGLGLTAAGCGGETLTGVADAQAMPIRDASVGQPDAAAGRPDVTDTGVAPADGGMDVAALVDASEGGAADVFDAGTVQDAAADVALDAWVQVPVK